MKKNTCLCPRRPIVSPIRAVCRRARRSAGNVLVIIGNGFDLHHGIPSSYWDFREYIADEDPYLLEIMEDHFDRHSLWSDFEGTLAYLDIDMIKEDAGNYLVSYGADDWSDAYHHDYQWVIDEVLNGITQNMPKLFTEWVLGLPITSDVGYSRLNLIRKAKFLTFNYTPTLEVVYQIPSKNICYLHQKAVNKDSQLILGHGIKPKPERPLTQYELEELESVDPRVLEGDRSLAGYFADTYKPTDQILRDNSRFFDSLGCVDEIHVLGHSLSEVDMPYFQRIVEVTHRSFPFWKVSFYKPAEFLAGRAALEDIGVPPDRIQMARITDIYSPQLSLFPAIAQGTFK